MIVVLWSEPHESHAGELLLHGISVEGDAAFGEVPMQYLLTAPQSTERLDSPLSLPGIMALRDAVRAHAYGFPVDRQLRESARFLSEHARRRDQRIEQLLIALKQTWPSLPEVQRASRDVRGRRMLLTRIIAMCIEQYYAPESES